MGIRTKLTLGLFAILICGSGAWLVCAANEPLQVNGHLKAFMRNKLDASSKVLEGLTTEDFAMIQAGAQTFQNMSVAEQWRVSSDPLYRQYSAEFGEHAGRLRQKARERNLDGATLAWVECTMSCIRCHKHVRAIKIVGR